MSRIHNMNGVHHSRSKWEDVPVQHYTPHKPKWEDPSRSFSSRYMSRVNNLYSSHNGPSLSDSKIGHANWLNGVNHSNPVANSGYYRQATSNAIHMNQNKPRKGSFNICLRFCN